ncbi:MAG: Uma2 family endonuclease [Bacteroidetes bacterium]|nr:Uma2 family endonuclease [Bacteroidota bacterium]
MKAYKHQEITRLDQLNEDSFEYSYNDYLKWQFQERVELIMGKIFPMSAPNTPHQSLAIDLAVDLKNYFKGKNCFVFFAPFDVRLPVGKKGNVYKTIVQPDLGVVCDLLKLEKSGIKGAPDLVVEILSPSNRQIEMHEKFEAYQASHVREYWIIHPEEKWMLQYILNEKYLFVLHKKYENLSRIESVIFPELFVEVAEYKPLAHWK